MNKVRAYLGLDSEGTGLYEGDSGRVIEKEGVIKGEMVGTVISNLRLQNENEGPPPFLQAKVESIVAEGGGWVDGGLPGGELVGLHTRCIVKLEGGTSND